jgi:tetratricopeptide (TPR) repeat protein
LNEGRVFGLEASLRREQHRISEALDLLQQGLAVSSKDERGFLLINKAKTLETAEDFEGAIATLRDVTPQISQLNPRLMFILRFDLAVNLCHVGRFADVAAFLPELQRLSVQLCKPLERLRVRWLEGWAAAGSGKLEEGVEILSSVKEDFVERLLIYDAALVTMDLADALLQLKRLAHVKALAKQMTPIFSARGVHEKALKALLLFKRAAEQEAATVELVRSIRVFLRRAQRKHDLEFIS